MDDYIYYCDSRRKGEEAVVSDAMVNSANIIANLVGGRKIWVDMWKGILIFLVICGHVAGGLGNALDGIQRDLFVYIYKVIYLFHMPAFFVVSGFLFADFRRESWTEHFKRCTRRLLVPYFAWGILSAAVFAMAACIFDVNSLGDSAYYGVKMHGVSWYRPFLSLLHAGGWPAGEGFRCNYVLWFLPCMFMVLMLHRLFRSAKISSNLVLMFISLLMGGVMRFYVRGHLPWCVDKVPFFFAFFTFGKLLSLCAGEFLQTLITSKRRGRLFACIGLIAFLCVAYVYPDLGLAWSHWSWYLCSVILAAFGSLLSLLFAFFLCSDGCVLGGRCFVFLGQLSLGVMLVHKFCVVPLQIIYVKVGPMSGLFSALYFLLVVLLSSTVSCWISVQLRNWMPWCIGEKRRVSH